MARSLSQTQVPYDSFDADMLMRGLAAGRKVAERAVVRTRSWADEHPGQLLVAGVVTGFILGKLLFGSRDSD